MAALVGVCRHGGEHAGMAPDLDRTGWDGVGAPESHGHSLDGAPDPREPGRGLSRVPTDDEFVHSVVSQDEMTQEPAREQRDASAPCRLACCRGQRDEVFVQLLRVCDVLLPRFKARPS
jgi:hypothetical protein